MSATALTIITAVVSLLGVLAVGVLVPVFLVGHAAKERREDQAVAARQHREDREAEWARQDAISSQAAQSQANLAAQAQRAADLLMADNRQAAATQTETNGKLDIIHNLVNSNMTAEMQARYDATKRELAVMREIMELKKAAGHEPSTETLAAIEATHASLAELEKALLERRKTQDKMSRGESEGSEA